MNSIKQCLLIAFCIFLNTNAGFAKEIKPQVLVYGDNVEAFAAAVQSAKSNVPTIWVLPSLTYCADLFSNPKSITVGDNISGGIWMNVLQEMIPSKEKKDSILNVMKNNIDFLLLQKALDDILEKQANLIIVKNTSVVKLVHSKNDLEVVLSNKSKHKVRAVVDATSRSVLKRLGDQGGLQVKATDTTINNVVGFTALSKLNADEIRTILAIGEGEKQIDVLTLNQVRAKAVGNLFFTNIGDANTEDGHTSIPFQFNSAQAIGACAAYCSFFKTTSDKIDVRKVQSELLSFDARILPFVDINIEDPNFDALQKIFLVNILPWNRAEYPYVFDSVDSVSVATVKPIIQKLYSRAQLWFIDNKSSYFTVKDAVELIKVLAFRGNELDAEVEKAWKKRFKFSSEFEPNSLINRYEFAVLLNAYADPFVKRVSMDGLIQQ